MFIELHVIQNFAPSNLNRDDTNSPKDCTFGGYRRARISSQCFKRAIRMHPAFTAEVGSSKGHRTKLLVDHIAGKIAVGDRDRETSRTVVSAVLQAAGYKVDDKLRTSVLLFLSPGELDGYAELISGHFDDLKALVDAESKKKQPGTIKLEKVFKKAIESLGSRVDAADIALFGRMIAEAKNLNIDAACQVAHAISTHPVQVEMDFYTAVDDLQPKEDTGAGMMGVIEFNSACFYRYAVVDTEQLVANLQGDKASAKAAVLGFLKAAVAAIPTGKQNSMAAHNPPSYVQVRVRDGGMLWSLANAFAEPVLVNRRHTDLALTSIEKLRAYDANLTEMYGADGVVLDRAASTYADHRDSALAELWQAVAEALA